MTLATSAAGAKRSWADVARAMQACMTERGHEAADSTVRERARKVWNAIQQDAES
jgi:hypothetical protein